MDTNGNQDIHDAAMRIGILSQRTTNLETLVQSINHSIGAMSSKVDERFNALAANMAERSRPQWQALGVMLTVLIVLGGLVYWPIRETTNDLKNSVLTLAQETNRSFELLGAKMVTREELDWRAARGTEDRERINAAVIDVRSTMVPRNEWMERNASRDHDIQNIRDAQAAAVMAVQRQIDQMRGDFTSLASSLGNGRDTFADLKLEQGRLRDQIAGLLARPMGFPGNR